MQSPHASHLDEARAVDCAHQLDVGGPPLPTERIERREGVLDERLLLWASAWHELRAQSDAISPNEFAFSFGPAHGMS